MVDNSQGRYPFRTPGVSAQVIGTAKGRPHITYAVPPSTQADCPQEGRLLPCVPRVSPWRGGVSGFVSRQR